MSDWQVGDLAVCVDTGEVAAPGGTLTAGNHLSLGAVYSVIGVRSPHRADTPGPILLLEGLNAQCGAWRFRKIRPDEREACEPEFVTLLKRSRKTVRA